METRTDISKFFDLPGQSGSGIFEINIPLPDFQFEQMINQAVKDKVILIGLFCVQDIENHPGYTLVYIFEKRNAPSLVVLKRHLASLQGFSVAHLYPSASWFEREIKDGFGIDFPNAFDKRRLFLHETYPDSFHPLCKNFSNQPVKTEKEIDTAREYQFKKMDGEGVYQIPVGPVHAGIIEPGHFHFSVIGETIFNLEIRMFYKHRGLEKLAEGKKPDQCTRIAESISGDESVCNSVAFSMAVENICGVQVKPRAWFIRTILLEMERIYSHLGDMAGMIVDVAFARGASPFFILREEIFRHNDLLTGSRFAKGKICPGGINEDISNNRLEALSIMLDKLLNDFNTAVSWVRSTSTVIDRFENTGIIKPELVSPLNITGPAARASGIAIDTRIDHPYGLYSGLELSKRIEQKGDVLARFDLKTAEIIDSIRIIKHAIKNLPETAISQPYQVSDGSALVLIESPRGQNLHWVNIKNGIIDRYKIRTASFCNWQVIEHAVLGNIVPDFPLINKSLNLSYSGTDL
jgi:Ni,Fe-hydrogenase III large subunit/Ni,Fe-hydrogenase III component G